MRSLFTIAAGVLITCWATCPALAQQMGSGSTAGQSRTTGSGSQLGASSFGGSRTPFGNLVGSGGGGSFAGQGATSGQGAAGSLLGGGAAGIFGGVGGDVVGAMGLSSIFSQQNQARSLGQGGAYFGGGMGVGGMGRGGMMGTRMMGQQRAGQRGNRGTRGGIGGTNVAFRRRLSVGFEHPEINDSRVIARLERVLETPDIQFTGQPLEVTMVATDEGTAAVLRGRVATPEDRLVAEQLVMLDPAISAVRNELQVGPPAPAASLPPPPSAPSASLAPSPTP